MSDNNDTKVRCVKITGGGTRYAPVLVDRTHPIFNSTPMPITTKIGYPLLISRMVENLPFGIATDNQHATWLNIDPNTGFAPPQWQGGIGDVIIANADGSNLDTQTLGVIVDYVSNILDAFGDTGGPPTRMYSRAGLDRMIENRKRGVF